ncbi:MAG: lipase family protein [Gordonia sp. (in: high G+C Gram-positive bacteria)]
MNPRSGARVLSILAASLALAVPTIAFPALSPSAHAKPAAPGTLLESSPLPAGLSLPSAASAQKMTYQTKGPHGLTPSTGVLYQPAGTPPTGGWPVVVWAHGTVGDSDFDAPSRTGEHPATSAYVDGWLKRGYAVAAPDYIGMGSPGIAPYLNCRVVARTVIDSVRAAHKLSNALADRWVVVGLSQGGQAAMCTANLVDNYAPELDYRGAVAQGVPSNIETLAPLGGPWFPPAGIFAGLTNFMTFAIAGLRDSRRDLDVNAYLTPLGRRLVDAAPRMSYAEFAKLSAGHSVAEMLSRSLADPVVINALRDYLGIPTTGYTKPIMLVQGAKDLVVPIPLTLKLVADLNLAGTHPDFRVVDADHIGSVYAAEAAAATFVKRALK